MHASGKAAAVAVASRSCAYWPVDCDDAEGDPWIDVHRVLREVAGKKLTSLRFRSFVTRAGIATGRLASHDADLLFQRLKGKAEGSEVGITSTEFGDLLLEIAMKKFPEE